MANIINEGGFNTGRMYSREGQRIYWWQYDDNSVVFYDLDRMIIGKINVPFDNGGAIAWWITAAYDRSEYSMACQPAVVDENFDFGVKLRI